jgi:hypothetical protein
VTTRPPEPGGPPADRPSWLPPAPAERGWGAPEPPPPRGGRVGGLAAVLVLLLVVGLAGGGLLLGTRRDRAAAPAGSGGAPGSAPATGPPATRAPAAAPPATPAQVRAVQRRVAELRGLRFRRGVPVTIESPQKLSRRLLRVLAEETDEAELARQGQALELLGQLPPGTDLPRLLREIQSESVLGFYLPGRPPKGRLFVRSSRGLDPYARLVLAHELTHAVTDQHYDLTRADRLEAATGREDELAAYSGLVEGDATLLMQRYLTEALTPVEQADAGLVAAGQRTPRQDAAPAAVRESLLFPYQAGLRFVRELYRRDGWTAVNRAYRDPPTSTEQLLHPERYLGTRDQPQAVAVPDLSGQLGPGWRPAVSSGFGEFDTRLLLQDKLAVTVAEAAGEGWDGGRLRTFQRGTRTALVLRTVWDSTAPADQFCPAMARGANERFGAGTRGGAGLARWSGSAQQTALVCQGSRAAWLSAPDRPALDRLLHGLRSP